MALNISYKQFPEFNPNMDPENVYAQLVNYAEQSKNNHLKVYNITDEAQQQSLLLDLVGQTLDIL